LYHSRLLAKGKDSKGRASKKLRLRKGEREREKKILENSEESLESDVFHLHHNKFQKSTSNKNKQATTREPN